MNSNLHILVDLPSIIISLISNWKEKNREDGKKEKMCVDEEGDFSILKMNM